MPELFRTRLSRLRDKYVRAQYTQYSSESRWTLVHFIDRALFHVITTLAGKRYRAQPCHDDGLRWKIHVPVPSMSSRRQVNRRTPGSVATADSSHDKMGDQRLVEFLSEITAVEEEANLKSHGQSFANAHELQNATFRLLLREETREIGNVQLLSIWFSFCTLDGASKLIVYKQSSPCSQFAKMWFL